MQKLSATNFSNKNINSGQPIKFRFLNIGELFLFQKRKEKKIKIIQKKFCFSGFFKICFVLKVNWDLLKAICSFAVSQLGKKFEANVLGWSKTKWDSPLSSPVNCKISYSHSSSAECSAHLQGRIHSIISGPSWLQPHSYITSPFWTRAQECRPTNIMYLHALGSKPSSYLWGSFASIVTRLSYLLTAPFPWIF